MVLLRHLGVVASRRLLIYVALPLAYVLAGRLGLFLAVPPGYATAVFLPAGIAVAAMFIAGAATLPVTFLSSVLLNSWIGYSLAHQLDATKVATALVIAFGSTLQAAIGGAVLRRAIGYPTSLDDPRGLLLFLLLSPVFCLASATVSLGGMWALGVVDLGDLTINWMTWWVGDTLGVLVALPLIVALAGESRTLRRIRSWFVVAPMIFCFALFAVIFMRVSSWENDQSLLEFRMRSQQLSDTIKANLEEQAFFLEQLSSVFVSRRLVVGRGDFHDLVQKLLGRFPTIQAVEWAPRVLPHERGSFEVAQQADLPGFAIRERDASNQLRPAGDRNEFYPVTYLEPLAGNEGAAGFDLGSDPNRRAAIEAAIGSGNVTASAPVRLVQERDDQAGVLLANSVRSGPTGPGIVLIVLRMGVFTSALFDPSSSLRVRFVDAASASSLFENVPVPSKPPYESAFDFGGRRYVVQTVPSPAYFAQHRGWQSWGVLAGGAFSTGLLGALLMLGTGHAYRFEKLADRLRDNEQRIAADLSAMTRLNKVGSRCLREENEIDKCLDEILRAAIAITGADKGNIQLLDPACGALAIAAQRGFEPPFLKFFDRVRDDESACGAAMQASERVIVEDVLYSQVFADRPSRDVMLDAGVRAVISAPLISSTGILLGMISTHFCAPHRPSERELHLLDLLVRQGADYLQRMRTGEILRAREHELEIIINRTPLMFTRCSRDLRYRFVSQAYAEMIGRQPGDVAGKPIVEIMGKDGFETIRPHVDMVLRGEPVEYESQVQFQGIGSRLLRVVYTPERDERGNIDGWIASILDVTDRRRAEAQRDWLIAEINHRVKNTLATVISIAHQSFSEGQSFEEAQRSFNNRIRALAHTHTRLADANWSGISLETIILDETAPYRNGSNVRIGGPEIILTPKSAVSLGMAIHELATNAAKYGALSVKNGSIEVTWQLAPSGREVRMTWAEAGGPTVSPPLHRGFGLRLLQRVLPSDLGGTVNLDFRQEGLRCLIAFPLGRYAGTTIEDSLREIGSVDRVQPPGSTSTAVGHHFTSADSLRGIRVLVVEDEMLVALEVQELLRSVGATIIGPFGDLARAKRAARSEAIDLAVLDVNLNGEMVYPLADDMVIRGIPFVIVTGYGVSNLPERFRAMPQVAKPFDPRSLAAELQRAIRGRPADAMS